MIGPIGVRQTVSTIRNFPRDEYRNSVVEYEIENADQPFSIVSFLSHFSASRLSFFLGIYVLSNYFKHPWSLNGLEVSLILSNGLVNLLPFRMNILVWYMNSIGV